MMKIVTKVRSLVPILALWSMLALSCAPSTRINDRDMRHTDAATDVVFPDLGTPDIDPGPLTPCGDHDPACQDTAFGPETGVPFPLATDPVKNPDEKDSGVGRNPNGHLVLDATNASFDFLWVANDSQGTTSKFNSKTVREVARYYTVTCNSLATGNTGQCDGRTGCCSRDDNARWLARLNRQQEPPHQSVMTPGGSHSPSRTTVDINGDLFVANRAFGGQSSVTKIANSTSDCVDRNKNGKIDSSMDADGNGVIDTNDPREFFGLSDECVLWTTNTGPNGAIGRPLGLGVGSLDTGISDAFPGSYQLGKFYQIDGKTGITKAEWQLPGGCNPYGLVVDSYGIGWAGNLGNGLCYFDTHKVGNVGKVKVDPASHYGISLDRDQNVWLGSSISRYTPNRTKPWDTLGDGWWTTFRNIGGSAGIAADSRSVKKYFVWTGGGNEVVRIPASEIPMVKMDQQIDGAQWPRIRMSNRGVGVDRDQNIWGVPNSSLVVRAIVDKDGNFKDPQQAPPVGNNRCPAGDTCDNGTSHYTYSDFTGFGLRNFTRPLGTYSMLVKGCTDGDRNLLDTQWVAINWVADAPPNTSLTVSARSGATQGIGDQTWGISTPATGLSPHVLTGVLVPNQPDQTGSGYLLVEFLFKSKDFKSSPTLKRFDVAFKCTRIQ